LGVDISTELTTLHEAIGARSAPAGWSVAMNDAGFEASWCDGAGRWACLAGRVSARRPRRPFAAVSTCHRLGGAWLELTCRLSDASDPAVIAPVYALLNVLPGSGSGAEGGQAAAAVGART
jgi:hypothetical protein